MRDLLEAVTDQAMKQTNEYKSQAIKRLLALGFDRNDMIIIHPKIANIGITGYWELKVGSTVCAHGCTELKGPQLLMAVRN